MIKHNQQETFTGDTLGPFPLKSRTRKVGTLELLLICIVKGLEGATKQEVERDQIVNICKKYDYSHRKSNSKNG